MVPAQVQPGDVLAGKYRVERVLGQGNMGVVVAASHVDLAQRVALKFMLPGAAAQKEHRERFLREARASVRLRSQHVAKVLDVGTLDGETPYIVMELLDGADLAQTLSKSGPLSFASAIDYVLQACEAVAEAHAAGVVHRDLKPANLFLTHDVGGAPCIKVLDFGISKSAGTDLTLTQDAQALGSPLYMSPEQMNSSRDVDARSDIWALGIVLYQLVAGVTPFHADSIQALCARVLMGTPTPLAELRPDAPAGFEAVIHRCLERDRERRFRSVAELAAALAPFASAAGIGYIQRISRVLGVAVLAPSALGASTGGAALPAATSSTVVMPSPGAAGTGPAALSGSSPAIASTGPAALSGSSPSTGAASYSGPLAASNGAIAPGADPAAGGAGTLGAVAATAPHLAGSGSNVGASQGFPGAAAPAPKKAPLVLAAVGGALLVAAIGVAVLRPWASPAVAGADPTAHPTVSSGPTPTAPDVVPAGTVAPSAHATAAPSSQPTAEVSATASAASAAPVATAKLTGVKPAVKPTSAPTSKPGVSYDDRR